MLTRIRYGQISVDLIDYVQLSRWIVANWAGYAMWKLMRGRGSTATSIMKHLPASLAQEYREPACSEPSKVGPTGQRTRRRKLRGGVSQ